MLTQRSSKEGLDGLSDTTEYNVNPDPKESQQINAWMIWSAHMYIATWVPCVYTMCQIHMHNGLILYIYIKIYQWVNIYIYTYAIIRIHTRACGFIERTSKFCGSASRNCQVRSANCLKDDFTRQAHDRDLPAYALIWAAWFPGGFLDLLSCFSFRHPGCDSWTLDCHCNICHSQRNEARNGNGSWTLGLLWAQMSCRWKCMPQVCENVINVQKEWSSLS